MEVEDNTERPPKPQHFEQFSEKWKDSFPWVFAEWSYN